MKNYKAAVFLFFLAYLIIGLVVFKDYGISWDDPCARLTGMVSFNYITHGDKELLTYVCKYIGSSFEICLVGIEKVLNLARDPRSLYLMRHLVTFLIFYAGVFFFYLLCKRRFNSWKMGLLGCLFLVLSPRIFADSFYNSKDTVFLALFTITIYTLIRYLNEKSLWNASLHALACAFAIDIRIAGAIVPIFTVVFFVTDLLTAKSDKGRVGKDIASLSLYLILMATFVILFWPVLWQNPIREIINALTSSKKYLWYGTVLYMGKDIKSWEVPWHYIPVWIAISTPLLYVASFLAGCFAAIKSKNRYDPIFISWFFLPLVSVIVSRPVLYDGWRHMFFIYPAFLMIGLVGLSHLWGLFKKRIIFASVIVLSLLNVLWFTVKYHPYQNVYFNALAGKDMLEIKNNFELDYWGLSYRQALEHILRNDPDKTIKICVANNPGKFNADILPQKERQRLVYVKTPEEAKYFLSNYRWHRGEYPYKDEYFSIKVGNAKIMVVYKL